ncbi:MULTISPECIES: hypothetical protein [Enterobacteriaceae]|uniref:hypothetical protein n=1 Tax=Enterobacteriaceae TaxID=543 RepID=UPI001D17C417|nr:MULTISPECIES: hypothetical protein [Enterobacteriaceae]WIK01608.1 hypothetical protein OI921_26390 [Klebsiella pneumoniae]
MSLSFIARVLRQLAIMFVLSVLIVAGYIYYAGKQHQQAAINFWGEQYQPDAISTQIDWGFIGNWVIPRGGQLFLRALLECVPIHHFPLCLLKLVLMAGVTFSVVLEVRLSLPALMSMTSRMKKYETH